MELRVQGTFGGKLFKFIVFFKKALLCFRSTGRHVGAGLSSGLSWSLSASENRPITSTIALNNKPSDIHCAFCTAVALGDWGSNGALFHRVLCSEGKVDSVAKGRREFGVCGLQGTWPHLGQHQPRHVHLHAVCRSAQVSTNRRTFLYDWIESSN